MDFLPLILLLLLHLHRGIISSPEPEKIVVMAVGPTGVGKSSLLNALLCPTKYTEEDADCHFETGSGLNSVTRDIEWREGRWLGEEGVHNTTLVAYDTPGLGDTFGRDPETLKQIAETIEAHERGHLNAFLFTVKAEERFDQRLQRQLRVLEYVFGPGIWDHFILTFTFYGFNRGEKKLRLKRCKKDMRLQFPDREERRIFCSAFDFEKEILSKWQEALSDFTGRENLTLPGVFVHPLVDWGEQEERRMFKNQSSILFDEIRKRPGLVCDESCHERMEISVRSTSKAPSLLGDATLRVEEGESLRLTCALFQGFERTVEKNSQLNFMFNRGTIQEDLTIGRVIERKGDDITKEAVLDISRAAMSDSGSYQCRLGTSGNFSEPTVVEVFQVIVGGMSKSDFRGMSGQEKIDWFKELEVTDQVDIVKEFDLIASEIVALYNSGLTDARRLDILTSEPNITAIYESGLIGDIWCKNSPNNTCEDAKENMITNINEIISDILGNANKSISGFGSEIIEPVYTPPSDITKTEEKSLWDFLDRLKTGLKDLKGTLKSSNIFATHQINKLNNAVTGIKSGVEKIQSGDGINIASGVLDLVSALAGFAGPYGLGVTAASELVNNILGTFGPDTMHKVIGKMITAQTEHIGRMLSAQSEETRTQMRAGFNNLIREMDVNTQKILDNADFNTKEILRNVTLEFRRNHRVSDLQDHLTFSTLAQACKNDFAIKNGILKTAIRKGDVQSVQTLQAEIGMADSVKDMTKLRSYATIFCTSPPNYKLCHRFLFTLASLSILRDSLYGQYFAFVKQSKASDADVVAEGIYDSLTQRKQWDKTFFSNLLMTSSPTSKGCHTACGIHGITNPYYNHDYDYDYDYESDLSPANVDLMFEYFKSLGGLERSTFNSSNCGECFKKQKCQRQEAVRSDSGVCKIWAQWTPWSIDDCSKTNVKNTNHFSLTDQCEVIRTRSRTCVPEAGGCSGMGTTRDEHRCAPYRHCPRIGGEDHRVVTSSSTVSITAGRGPVHIFAVGGGGGGSGSGGGSGFHNITTVYLARGDVLNVTIGAGGKEKWRTTSGTIMYGNDGSDSIVSLNGIVILKADGGRAGGCCGHFWVDSYSSIPGGHVKTSKAYRNPAQGGAGWSGGGNQGVWGSAGTDGGSGGGNGQKRTTTYNKQDGGSGEQTPLPNNLQSTVDVQAGRAGSGSEWKRWWHEVVYRLTLGLPSLTAARGGGGGGVLVSGEGTRASGATGFGAGGGHGAGDGMGGVVVIYT